MTSLWPEIPLADLCDEVQYGYTASAADEPIGPKFLRITDIVPDTLSWADVPYCELEPSKLPKYRLFDGDIVIARTGATVGYAKYLKNPPLSVFASYLVRFRVSESHVARYVGQVVESALYKEYIKTHAGGAAQPNASAKVLGSFPVPIPPRPTQEKIAAVLAAYDELMENNLRRIEISEKMAQAIYREWFVNFRYPGHEADELIDSQLGPIPKEWEVVSLGERIELAYGKALRADDRRRGDVAVFGSSGVVGWHDAALVAGPGIVIGRKGNVGSVHWSDGDFYPIDTTFYVKTDLSLVYVVQNLRRQNFINSDAAVPGLKRNQAYANPFLVPPVTLLDSYQDLVSPLMNLRRNLEKHNANLLIKRDLLLPKLVSGEIDVSELEIDTSWLVA